MMFNKLWHWIKRLFGHTPNDHIPEAAKEGDAEPSSDTVRKGPIASLYTTAVALFETYKSWGFTLTMVAVGLLSTYAYLHLHGVKVSFYGVHWPSEFTFIESGNTFAITAEVIYWSSITVLVRSTRTLFDDIRGRNFNTPRYMNRVFIDWLTTPLVIALALFFANFFEFKFSEESRFSVDDLGLDMVIAISCILAYKPRLLTRFLDQIESRLGGNNPTCKCHDCKNYKAGRRRRH